MATTPLVAVVGPTASGKSALAIELAQQFNGEIICADSRTVYKYLNIGTDKPSPAQREAATHHLLDIVEVNQRFTVADFKQRAEATIDSITQKGKLPILVGGTGLYVDAVLFNYQFSQPGAQRDPLNPRHLKQTNGQPDHEKLRSHTLVLGLQVPRAILQERISQRVHTMWQGGLVQETRDLVARYGWESHIGQTIGYQELKAHVEGTQSAQETIDLIIKNTLAYAKRQQTWFKRNKSIQWLNDPRKAVELTTTFLSKLQ